MCHVICSVANGSCEYRAEWRYDENTDRVHFTVQTRNIDKWTGIGFSETPSMVSEGEKGGEEKTKTETNKIQWFMPL